MPPRNYGLLAKLLVEAVASDDSGTVGSTVAAVARQAGQDSVSGTGVVDALCRCGYEPAQRADGDIELRNCPFHQLARQYPELVCSLNLQLIQGMLEANGDQPERAVLAPRECGCCVIVRAPKRPARNGSAARPKRHRGRRATPRSDAAACATAEGDIGEPAGNTRVAVPGDADRHSARGARGPRWLRALSRASGPLGRMLPLGALDMFVSLQRVALPVYTPALPLAGMNAAVVDRAAL